MGVLVVTSSDKPIIKLPMVKPLIIKTSDNKPANDFKPSMYDIVRCLPDVKVLADNHKTIKYDGFLGDERVALALLLQAVVGNKCILLSGNAASGKTNLLSVISTFSKKPYEFRAGTEKSAIYAAEGEESALADASLYIISEINRITDTNREMLKYFGEQDDYIYRRTGKPDITIKCKGFITCLADENKMSIQALGQELISRLTTLSLDSTTTQNKRVIDAAFKKKRNPFKQRVVDDTFVNSCQDYVKALPYIYDYEFIHPASEIIASAVPYFFTSNRRDAPKYLANCEAVCLFNFKDRLMFEHKKKRVIPITPQDEFLNYLIFGSLLRESALRCDKTQRMLLDLLIGSDKHIPVGALQKQMKSKDYWLSVDVIQRKMDDLFQSGYVSKMDKYELPAYKLSNEFLDFTQEIDWNNVVETSKHNFREDWESIVGKEMCDKYDALCSGEYLKVIHPFTGEVIDILNFQDVKRKIKSLPVIEVEVDDAIKPKQDVIDMTSVDKKGNSRLVLPMEDKPEENTPMTKEEVVEDLAASDLDFEL